MQICVDFTQHMNRTNVSLQGANRLMKGIRNYLLDNFQSSMNKRGKRKAFSEAQVLRILF
jgi:hypothetical protein